MFNLNFMLLEDETKSYSTCAPIEFQYYANGFQKNKNKIALPCILHAIKNGSITTTAATAKIKI